MKGNSENPNIFSGCGEDGGSIVIENSSIDFGFIEIDKLNNKNIVRN